ncbi:MAG TPA: helix-turn-helix domain-containing protein, partial [Planctomycetaceae bacterium]|nr:helix-turn-helix domain-containing protein [Planctomycetaceae bacterium]
MGVLDAASRLLDQERRDQHDAERADHHIKQKSGATASCLTIGLALRRTGPGHAMLPMDWPARGASPDARPNRSLCVHYRPKAQRDRVPAYRHAIRGPKISRCVPYLRYAFAMSLPSRFDVGSLARYLHIRPEQVVRMAERGQLPGRKVGGKWCFSGPDIHHWLEARIGASDEDELVAVESALRQQPDAPPDHTLLDLLPESAVAIPLPAKTRSSVIAAMCGLAAESGWLWDPQRMAELVRQREALHPTALDNGVALLHPRRPQPQLLAQAVLALGITSGGVPFGGPTLTDVFF